MSRSVFKAPLMNLRQLKNKAFKNSTGFKKHGRILIFFISSFSSASWIFFDFFSWKLTGIKRLQSFFLLFFFLKFCICLVTFSKNGCIEAFLKCTTIQLFQKVKAIYISLRYLDFRSGLKMIKFQILDGFLESFWKSVCDRPFFGVLKLWSFYLSFYWLCEVFCYSTIECMVWCTKKIRAHRSASSWVRGHLVVCNDKSNKAILKPTPTIMMQIYQITLMSWEGQ